jgi:hypothetical protein
MGQALTPEQMPDAVLATLNKLNRGKWIGEMVDLQEHVGFNQMCKAKRETVAGGRGSTVRYVMDHNHSAQQVGLFGTMEFSRDDAVVEGTIPWTYTDGNMVFDEREPDINSGPEQVFDLIKMENARMMTSIVDHCEPLVWGIPESSDDNDTPFGVEYWVTKNATLGFNGGNPSGFTAGRAGVSSATYSRHKNFTGAYSTIDDTEDTGLIYMMEMAADKTKWVAPAPEPGMGRKGYSTRGIYCSWETKNAMKNVAKSNNDSLGFDLSTQMPVFRGAGITYVPYFDSKTDYPVYMLDHNHIYAKFLKNWFLKKVKVQRLPNQPHCFAVIVSMVWNVECDDLRRQVVFHYSA